MNTLRRIAALHRELADAYDDLAKERAPKRVRRQLPEHQPVDPDVAKRVDRGIRKAGLRT